MKIIAVDWGKEHRKRSAYLADAETRDVRKFQFDGSLSDLVTRSETLPGPVLIAIDAAIGFPKRTWDRLTRERDLRSTTFLEFLLGDELPGGFFEAVQHPDEWAPSRPFISPPSGEKWSRKAFEQVADDGFNRRVDVQLGANPIFITSGIPGSVGSGTRALWQELIGLPHKAEFWVWPFQGELDVLLGSGRPVIAEIYPKACYGVALSEHIPAPLRPIAKTQELARAEALNGLLQAQWLSQYGVNLNDVDPALANEDHFDALISAAALLRLVLEGVNFDKSDQIDRISEGSVLGSGSLDGTTRRANRVRSAKRITIRTVLEETPRSHPCPIPGCTHVFRNTRGGWDAHIGSLKRHPDWHPEEADPARRRILFKNEFPEWF